MANSPRLGIPKPDENATPDVPRDLGAVVDRVDLVAMSVDVGPLSSRPPSSPSTPGTTGHAFVATDQPLTGPRLDVDTGTGFFTVGPAPVDAAANIPSSRTLGQGATQACAGNDPRLVGGASASGDIAGDYPGPLTVTTWNGQSKAQVVASVPPQTHGSSHLQGAADPIVGITDAQIAAANKDGPPGTAGMRTLGQGAQQACAGNDPRLVAPSPIGAIVAYSGNGDPPETDWLVADGRLIDRTTYAEFFSRTGHAYNGGVDPGGNKVRIPDKRGKKSVGAINMGTGAGPNDNAHLQAARGTSYGEVNHQLLAAEGSTNGNGATGYVSNDHTHTFSTTTGLEQQAHTHGVTAPTDNFVGHDSSASPAGRFQFTASGGYGMNAINSTGGEQQNHNHAVSGGTSGISTNHTHVLNARNADSGHNNIDPSEADSYIVRVL